MTDDDLWLPLLTCTPASTQTDPLPATATETGESDSNYDIIPFSDTEYEKLTVATDDDDISFTDDNYEESNLDDAAIDSALGRSVSDQSVAVSTCPVALSTAVAIVKATDGGTMRAASGKHSDSHDVGYSSESQSNEEPEVARAMAENSGIAELRSRDLTDVSADKQQWRQSMTSAYDTSSNCSELMLPSEILDLPDVVERDDESVEGDSSAVLNKTASSSFYCMTTIESLTDTEPSSMADRIGGDNTDVEELIAETLAEVPVGTSGTISTADSRSDVMTSEKPMSIGSSNPDIQLEPHAKPNNNDFAQLTTALNRYVDKYSHSLDNVRRNSSSSSSGGNIRQHTALSNDDIKNGNRAFSGRRWSRPIAIPQQRRHQPPAHDSYTSTDGSVLPTDCDASSEGHSSDTDVSTASSDNDEQDLFNNSSALCSRSRSLGASPVKMSSTPRKTLCFTDLRTVSEGAIDDAKLHHRHQHNLALRRTTSDTPPLLLKPCKQRRRRLRRTKSDELNTAPYSTSGRPSGRSSPVHAISASTATTLTAAVVADSTMPCVSCGEGVPSAVELSEQAWDNYQVAPYSSVSEDPAEEKLDASHLASADWEHNLEFEEDFHLDSTFGSGLRGQQMVSKNMDGKL